MKEALKNIRIFAALISLLCYVAVTILSIQQDTKKLEDISEVTHVIEQNK